MIRVIGPRDKSADYINTTSRSTNWSRGLSPFFLGPVKLYGKYVARNVENGWQFSKVFLEHDADGAPSKEYFEWAEKGWRDNHAHRYPMGKGKLPLYSYWDGQKLDYVSARKKIYVPLYIAAVQKSDAFKTLLELYKGTEELTLWDFDGYDHRKLGMTLKDVANCADKKMGHAFVLAMLLHNIKHGTLEVNAYS